MSYYPNKINSIVTSYKNETVAHDVGRETKDSYSIDIFYKHNIETDEIVYASTVVKNCCYNDIPKDITKIVKNKKYKESLFTGTLKECFKYIDNIVQSEGYWDKHPTESFKEIFIEPTI